MSSTIRLPTISHRITIMGPTGSGKTFAGLWHLSKMPFDVMPWVILDFKTDDTLNSIQRAKHISLSELPKLPGIYIVHPLPSQTEDVTNFLWKIWERCNIGLVVDEGFMLGNNEAFEAILTQGRSKHIPCIILTQRPSWISRFAFSESNFYQVFNMSDKRDRKTVESFIPHDLGVRLPQYHSYYFDVAGNQLHRLSPVPDEATLLATIDERLRPIRREL